MNQDQLKQAVAEAALHYLIKILDDNTDNDVIIGIGTGSTANYFIDELATIKHRIGGTVASSAASTERLKSHNIPVFDLNSVTDIPVYVDGTDEVNPLLQLIKGGGGALTREKIIAAVANKFICIADQSKQVEVLGKFPLPVEVIPMARSYVARELVKLGGDPVLREGFTTDNGNIILDTHNLTIGEPLALETKINQITGVVCVGLFAQRGADVLMIGTATGVDTITA